MPDYTTRLGLAKPSDGENYDVDVVNANSDIVDGAVGAKNVTSTTRPATPYIGQIIFETDTKYLLVWDGVVWSQILYRGRAAWASQRGDLVACSTTAAELLRIENISLPNNSGLEVEGSWVTWSSDANALFQGAFVFEKMDGTGTIIRDYAYRANSGGAAQSNTGSGKWIFETGPSGSGLYRVILHGSSLNAGVTVNCTRSVAVARLI